MDQILEEILGLTLQFSMFPWKGERMDQIKNLAHLNLLFLWSKTFEYLQRGCNDRVFEDWPRFRNVWS